MGQWVRADLRPATGTRGDAYASPSPVPVYVCRDEDEALGCFRAAPELACAVCAVPQPAQTRRLLKRRRGRRARLRGRAVRRAKLARRRGQGADDAPPALDDDTLSKLDAWAIAEAAALLDRGDGALPTGSALARRAGAAADAVAGLPPPRGSLSKATADAALAFAYEAFGALVLGGAAPAAAAALAADAAARARGVRAKRGPAPLPPPRRRRARAARRRRVREALRRGARARAPLRAGRRDAGDVGVAALGQRPERARPSRTRAPATREALVLVRPDALHAAAAGGAAAADFVSKLLGGDAERDDFFGEEASCLRGPAAPRRPGDCVDAFRFCDAVPWLLELLGPPDCRRSLAASSREPSTPVALEPLAASFEAGDGVLRVPALRLSPAGPAPPDGVDDLWCLDVPVGAESSRPATDGAALASARVASASARRMTRSLSIGGGDEPTPSLSCITGGAPSPSPRTPGDPLLEFDVPPLLPATRRARAPRRRRRAPALDDDELHELVVTLLLVLAVGRSSEGGELEPAFCTAHPLSDTGTGIRSHPDRRLSASALRSLNESPMTPTGLRPEHRRSHGALTGRSQSLTARSLLSARSALVGTEGSALGFHLLDALHRHCNGGDARGGRGPVPRGRRAALGGLESRGAGLRAARGVPAAPAAAPGGAGRRRRRAAGRAARDRGRVLGGRFGVVVALDGATCAKLLRRERSHRDRSVAHGVFAEVSALARLGDSDAAPRLLDFGVVDDCYVLVLERCAQGTLFDWREARKRSGPPTDGDCLAYARVFAKVARRVAACAERRVVHLDLKLENVLLRGDPLDGPDGALCVCDFGEARLLGAAGDARITRAHGTEAVAAPEVVLGVQQSGTGQAAPVGPPADVWALGCLLYELVAGRKLFEDAVASDWPLFFVTLSNEAAPLPHEAALEPLTHLACKPALLDLLQTALRRDPAARDTAGQLAANADLFADGRPLVLRPAPPGPPRRLSSV
ncbi:TTK protein kinase [Aureococcus anophagefferens]|uniref:non-specific serine/threonine protein kinase n=1 Tax=Aureococcus anophagefferens TaxID=44056 RepID=A0ABR1FYM1_AURAN